MPRRKKQPEPSNEYKPCCPWCGSLRKRRPVEVATRVAREVVCLDCGAGQMIETDQEVRDERRVERKRRNG